MSFRSDLDLLVVAHQVIVKRLPSMAHDKMVRPVTRPAIARPSAIRSRQVGPGVVLCKTTGGGV